MNIPQITQENDAFLISMPSIKLIHLYCDNSTLKFIESYSNLKHLVLFRLTGRLFLLITAYTQAN